MWDFIPHGSTAFIHLLPYLDENSKDKIYKLIEKPASVFAAAFPYYAGEKSGNISLYARGRDYHSTVSEELRKKCAAMKSAHPLNTFIPLVDVSPIPEVTAGALCGIGLIGKNQLLINSEYGSFFFIGCILSDLEIPLNSIVLKACTGCNKCIQSCPTSALTNKGFEKEKCLSYITQKRGGFEDDDRSALKKGDLIWGCDICQNVCPYNKKPIISPIQDFTRDLICNITLTEIENLSNSSFKKQFNERAFTWRGVSPLLRNLKFFNSLE